MIIEPTDSGGGDAGGRGLARAFLSARLRVNSLGAAYDDNAAADDKRDHAYADENTHVRNFSRQRNRAAAFAT